MLYCEMCRQKPANASTQPDMLHTPKYIAALHAGLAMDLTVTQKP